MSGFIFKMMGTPTPPPPDLDEAFLSNHSLHGLQWPEPNPLPPPVFTYDTASASFTLTNTGQAIGSETTGIDGGSDTFIYPGEWLPTGTESGFEVMATIIAGSIDSGTVGVWQNLGTTRSWTNSHIGPGGVTTILQIQIRRIADGAIVSAQITLEASRT